MAWKPFGQQPTENVVVEKFRAASDMLAAQFASKRSGGRHAGEKGMRAEFVLIDFLKEHLPPRYGVSRGEVFDSKGMVARQCDVVIYDALHAPILHRGDASQVFPAESVYAVIEMKPDLNKPMLAQAVNVLRSVKQLDRSAVTAHHDGHHNYRGRVRNPSIFGAVFALRGSSAEGSIVPNLKGHDFIAPPEQKVDCVCVLGKELVYHFAYVSNTAEDGVWIPAASTYGTHLGYYESGRDTLLLFYLFLLHQLNARSLFPPDFLQYVAASDFPAPKVDLSP